MHGAFPAAGAEEVHITRIVLRTIKKPMRGTVVDVPDTRQNPPGSDMPAEVIEMGDRDDGGSRVAGV